MLAPFSANPALMSLKDDLLSHQDKIADIKSRVISAQHFENAARIKEVDKAMNQLISAIDRALQD